MNTLAAGSVHGRFQPFHNGHLEYFSAARQFCDFLWIGITQYNRFDLASSPVDPHRESPVNNPLSYFERYGLIEAALLDEGWNRSTFGILPFPIDTPSNLNNFLPLNIPIFTTIYDDWNRHKVSLLRSLGYKIIVLWERSEKAIDGLRIRESIRQGDLQWKASVPQATARAVERLKLAQRLGEN